MNTTTIIATGQAPECGEGTTLDEENMDNYFNLIQVC